MATKADAYRQELRKLRDWEPYLEKYSGLPGPRANLELVAAVVEEGDADTLWKLSASTAEFVALCGTAGLGRIALLEPDTVLSWLRKRASDERWRVREGVAMALQRIGRENMPMLLGEMREWARGDAYVQRAAVAGMCEPSILKNNAEVVEVLEIVDAITSSLGATVDRRTDGFRVLRQTLGYGWSVAAAAAPENAKPYFEKWMRSTDKDIIWILQSNFGKARIAALRDELVKPVRRPRSGSRAK